MEVFNFTETEEFKELNDLYQELYENGEYEDAEDVFFEIHQCMIDFNSNLPDWFKIRWRMKESSNEVFAQALKEYEKNIYGWA